MAIIEIQVGNSRYKVQGAENERTKILHLAEKLDLRIKKLFEAGLTNVDEKTLLVICAIMAQDEAESKPEGISYQETITKYENKDEEKKLNEDDMYIAIAENIENVADYLEKLAKKIENY